MFPISADGPTHAHQIAKFIAMSSASQLYSIRRNSALLLLFPALAFACLSANPGRALSSRARALGVGLNTDNSLAINHEGLLGGDIEHTIRRAEGHGAYNQAISSKCPSETLLPYSAGELRTIASLYPLNDEAPKTVKEGGRLTCSFDDEDEFCSWYNVQSGGVRFWRARYENIFDLERFDCTSERSFPFEDFFLLAGGEATLLPQTVAIETRIPCQFGNATLTFDFWINTEEPVLRLCAITSDNYFNCEEMAEWANDAPISTSIPPSLDPFKIRIEISGLTSEAIVLIDNIRYEGQICELMNDEVQITRDLTTPSPVVHPTLRTIGNRTTIHSKDTNNQEAPVPAPPPPPPPEEQFFSDEDNQEAAVPETESVDVCEALTCTFNQDHPCMYSLGGIGSTSPWYQSHEFVGNRLTGIHQNSPGDYHKTGFVFVGENHKDIGDEVFVMESARFTLHRSVKLSFDLFLRSFGPQLKVCIDSFDYCPYASPAVDKGKFWLRNQHIFIPPGERKIFFIAGKLSQNLFMAVDNIQVTAENGDPFCDTNNRRLRKTR